MIRAPESLEAARALHAKCLVLDSHCDTTQRLMNAEWDFTCRHDDGHVDLPRLREGGVSCVVMAVFAPGPMKPGEGPAAARKQLHRIKEVIAAHPAELALARHAQDVRQSQSDGRLAILIGIEGGYLLDDSVEALREFRREGAVYLTLTHGFHTSWADSSGIHEELASRHGGLTDLGREMVCEMNRLGMMVDVSHVSDAAFWQVAEVSRSAILASHSSCRSVSPHRRNLSDDMMIQVARSGGVVQINFAAAFVDPTFPPIDPKVIEYWSSRGGFAASPYARHSTPLSRLVDHFEHAIGLIGYDHVGIGSDFDGVGALPQGMEDCSRLPYLAAELLERGHLERDLEKVLGANFLRVMEQCQRVTPQSTPG